MISAFSFGHNLIEGGYPFKEAIEQVWLFVDEVVFVEAQSTDGTRQVLEKLARHSPCSFRIIDAEWGQEAGETLARLHAMHTLCTHDTILHFEADEVMADYMASDIRSLVRQGTRDILIYRIQIEQGFQRARWYPELVHRVFPKGSVRKIGHTTDRHEGHILDPSFSGFLWDCTNCFRDNWLQRIKNQAELRKESLNMLMVPAHVNLPTQVQDIDAFLSEPHWTWKASPFDLPEVLKKWVGRTRYEPLGDDWR